MKQKMRVGASASPERAARRRVHVVVVAAVAHCLKWESSRAVHPPHCRSRRDSCGPSGRQTSAVLAAFLAPAVVLRSRCCCRADPAAAPAAPLLEELLLLPSLVGPGAAWAGQPVLRLLRRLLLLGGWRLLRLLGLLRLRGALLVRLVFAATPAAPMPLRLALAIGRAGPSSGWGCVGSVVMRALPGTLLLSCIISLASALPFTGLLSFPLCRRVPVKGRVRSMADCPLVDAAARCCRRNCVLERNLPRHLRTHDALTVGVPFLPGESRHSSAPSTIACRQDPRGECPLLLRCDSRAKHLSKRSSLLSDINLQQHLSGCLDRYDSASVSWVMPCPIGSFAASA